MLQDKWSAIDSDDIAVGENLLKNTKRLGILRDAIGWHQNGAIDYQEIGIGSRQPMPVGGKDGFRPGQRK